MGNFVHLHLHTEYSLLDGACVIKRLVKHVKNLGQTAVAITDHGNMYGAVEFYKACKEEGIKPIIGCEVYVAPRGRFDKTYGLDNSPYHLVLLCKNRTGYENLIKLVSKGYIDGFYNKPRIDREILSEYNEGLICLSACLAGEIPRRLVSGDYEAAKEAALFYQNTFGKDNYYLELQNHGIDEQIKILPLIKKLSEELSIPMVATNDCHYIEKEDSKTQAVLMCIQTNTVYGEDNALEFPTDEFYVKSQEEMEMLFSDYNNAVKNTEDIAERCNFDFEFGVIKLPKIDIDGAEDNTEYFVKLCKDGLIEKYGENADQAILERLDYELSVIIQMGYVDYFLIVWDFVHYAKSNNIPVGPGRGSGAGSLCAYCIGITDIDPLKYDLLFERFLNPERISMPDFDIDFCYEKRQNVIDYVVQKYGSNHVAQIITFGTMAAKGAIRDVGRALGMPYQSVDSIAKLVPFELNITLDRALQISKGFKDAYNNDEKVRELIDTARKLEGMPRHASTHAAGVVITRDEADCYVPLQKNDESIVTQYTMTVLEELGLLKMDFLGLRTLTVIDHCEKDIKKINRDFKVSDIDITDKDVYKMLSDGDTEGVFQFESEGMKRVLSQLKPDSLEDLIAVISLYRPGPMESIPTYIKNRHNPEKVTYLHPLLKPILSVTYGCIVYQEQVMQICRQLAGYSYGRADLVRRAMAKKKSAVMEKERQNFIYGKTNEDGTIECVGAVKNGVSENVANTIFDQMSSFAAYAFNKSHAAAYAYIAYQTAFLKCHYKKEYMAALLTSVLGNSDKIIEYIAECGEMNIKVLPPSINSSMLGFTVNGGNINFGLLAIKNLGKGVIDNIVYEREKNGSFVSLHDFLKRMHGKELNKRAVESLIKSGAFDEFPNNRKEMMSAYENIMNDIDSDHKSNITGQIDLFETQENITDNSSIPKANEYSKMQILAMEKEMTGLYLSGHPLDDVKVESSVKLISIIDIINCVQEKSKLHDGSNVRILCTVQGIKTINTRKNEQMAFLNVEDKTGTVEVIVFSNTFYQQGRFMVKDAVLIIEGKISIKEDEAPKIVCDRLFTPESYVCLDNDIKNNYNKLYISLESRNDDNLKTTKAILDNYPGTDVVYFYFRKEKKYLKISNYGVNCSQELMSQLKKVVDEKNIVLKKRFSQNNVD